MSGLLPTKLEQKLCELGFLSANCQIIRGPFKDCDYYLTDLGTNEDGDLTIKVGPLFDIENKHTFLVSVSKNHIDELMTTPGMSDYFVLKSAISYLAEPIVSYIDKESTDKTKEILEKEQATNLTLSKKDRREFSKQFFINNDFDTPMPIFERIKNMPKEFLQSEGVLDEIKTDIFYQLSMKALSYSGVEAIIALRAVTTQTVVNLVDVINDEKQIYQETKTFEKGLASFDERMENKLDDKCKV